MDTGWIYAKLDSIIKRIGDNDLSSADIQAIEDDLFKIERCKAWVFRNQENKAEFIDRKILLAREFISRKISENRDNGADNPESREIPAGENKRNEGENPFPTHLPQVNQKDDLKDVNTEDIDSLAEAFERQVATNVDYWIKQVSTCTTPAEVEQIKREYLSLYKQYAEFLEIISEDAKNLDRLSTIEQKLAFFKKAVDEKAAILKVKPGNENSIQKQEIENTSSEKTETTNEIEKLKEEITSLKLMVNELKAHLSDTRKHLLYTERQVKVLTDRENRTLAEKLQAMENQASANQGHIQDMINNLLVQIRKTRISDYREQVNGDRKILSQENFLNVLSIIQMFTGDDNVYQSLKELFRIRDLHNKLSLLSEKLLVFAKEKNGRFNGESENLKKMIDTLVRFIGSTISKLDSIEQQLIPGGFARFSINYFFDRLSGLDENEIDSFAESYGDFIREQLKDLVFVDHEYYEKFVNFVETCGAGIFQQFEEIGSVVTNGGFDVKVGCSGPLRSIGDDLAEIMQNNMYCKLINMPDNSLWDDREFYPGEWIDDKTIREPVIEKLITRGLFLEIDNDHINMKRYILPGKAVVRGPEEYRKYAKLIES
jgi:hypothetical protein